MKNAGLPAMPVLESRQNTSMFNGLTKREELARSAMQGIISSRCCSDFGTVSVSKSKEEGVAIAAVKHADALLAELERTK